MHEILTEALIEENTELLKSSQLPMGIISQRKQVFLDKVLTMVMKSKQYLLRLFKKNLGRFRMEKSKWKDLF